MLLTANLFPLTCFGIAAVLNTIAIGCGPGFRPHSGPRCCIPARIMFCAHVGRQVLSADDNCFLGIPFCFHC